MCVVRCLSWVGVCACCALSLFVFCRIFVCGVCLFVVVQVNVTFGGCVRWVASAFSGLWSYASESC